MLQQPASIEDAVAHVLISVVTVVNHQTEYGLFVNSSDKRIVGSGFIVDEAGYIVTNAHVVTNADTINVVLTDGQELTATLVVRDPSTDLALIKVEAEELSAADWGDSSEIRLGQSVVAIGSALGDFPNSVTVGVVSGLNRALALDEAVVQNLIQTDAAINQGNSGGPLINLRGEIIGINTFMIREDHNQGVAQGIGFAIPASSAKALINAWIAETTDLPLTTDHQHMEVPTTPLPVYYSGDSR
jgi:2-alkenal reductase